MNDDRTIPPPLPPPLPAPVLSYELAAPPKAFWLARLICGLAIGYATVAVGYVAAARIPSANPTPHTWTDLPVAVAGLVMTASGVLGVLRVRASRLGIAASAVLLMLCSWVVNWVSLRSNGLPDTSTIAFALVNSVDNSVVPVFLMLCLVGEPIKGYFTSRGRPGKRWR